MENRRSSARYAVDIEATVTIGDQQQSVRLTNLSLGGAMLVGLDRLPMETQLSVAFPIPTYEDGPIKASGVVRWSSELAIGVQFGPLGTPQVWSLNKYFEELD